MRDAARSPAVWAVALAGAVLGVVVSDSPVLTGLVIAGVAIALTTVLIRRS